MMWTAPGSKAYLDLNDESRGKEDMWPTAPSGFVYVPQGRNQGHLEGLVVHGEGGTRHGTSSHYQGMATSATEGAVKGQKQRNQQPEMLVQQQQQGPVLVSFSSVAAIKAVLSAEDDYY
jgi:hypothetical protein